MSFPVAFFQGQLTCGHFFVQRIFLLSVPHVPAGNFIRQGILVTKTGLEDQVRIATARLTESFFPRSTIASSHLRKLNLQNPAAGGYRDREADNRPSPQNSSPA